jgi:hypothetical protein
VQKLRQDSSPFRYVVTADVGTMGNNQDEGNAANWNTSGWSSSWLSISMAALD